MIRSAPRLLLALSLTTALSLEAQCQAGVWVFDGWTQEGDGYFAGKTEVVVDGARMRITEWPEDKEDLSLTLVTYHLGNTVVKVFPWNGERVALVFEAKEPLPAPQSNDAGQLQPPAPFPPPGREAELPCGDGCVYHVGNASFTTLDPAMFGPGGAMANTFVPDPALELLTQQEFMDTHNLVPEQLGFWGVANRP